MSGRRVAQILGTSTGGIGTHVASVTRQLLERGDRVTVLGPAETDEQFGFKAAGARFVSVDIPPDFDPRRDAAATWTLRRALRGPGGGTPDVVHAHGLRAGLASRLSRVPRVPLVVSFHVHLDTSAGGAKNQLLAAAQKAVARGADVCLCTDPDQVTGVWEMGGRDVRYVPVGAPELPDSSTEAATVKAGLDADGRPLILTVGRLHEVKRLDVLIDAAARWTDLDPRPLVVIAGDGPQRPELAARIERTQAPVRLLGHRNDVADLLGAADLAVVTSDSETRQFFAQEALRAGTALLATKAGGIPDLVQDAARLVAVGDVAAVDSAVRELLSDDTAREELSQAGPKRAASWPSEQDTVDQIDALYRELTGR